jgi:hypothetical protein
MVPLEDARLRSARGPPANCRRVDRVKTPSTLRQRIACNLSSLEEVSPDRVTACRASG